VDKESEARLLQALNGHHLSEYAQSGLLSEKIENMPDYAEVDTSHALTTFQGKLY